jgi:hypothetical protein
MKDYTIALTVGPGREASIIRRPGCLRIHFFFICLLVGIGDAFVLDLQQER